MSEPLACLVFSYRTTGEWLKVGPVFNLDFQTSLRLRTSGAEGHHERLVAAIAAGDGAQARFALSEDIRTSSSFIFSLGLLPDGALEVVNEAAFDACGSAVSAGDDPVEIDGDVVKELCA